VQRFLEQGVEGLANKRELSHQRLAPRPALAESQAMSA